MSYTNDIETLSVVEDFQPKFNFKPQQEIHTTDYKVLSLFSGCGGMDLGFQGGFEFRGKKYNKNSGSKEVNSVSGFVIQI